MSSVDAVEVIHDQAYRPGLAMDIYGRSANGAAIVLLHGGGWFHGDKSKDADLAARLALTGFQVFVPNYGLTPDHPFPGGREDVLAVIEWVIASDHPFDRGKVAIWGGSAGGNLAVEAALSTGRPAVSWSGLLDLKGFIAETDDTPAAAAPDVDFSKISSAAINQGGRNDPFLRWVILQLVANNRDRLEEATPIGRASARSGPIFMANSIGEFVRPTDAMHMQAALCAVGVESVVQLLTGTQHLPSF
jgi:acetyl esterase